MVGSDDEEEGSHLKHLKSHRRGSDYQRFLKYKRSLNRRGFGGRRSLDRREREEDSDDFDDEEGDYENAHRDVRSPLTKATSLRKYHERFLKKYHDYDQDDEFRGIGKIGKFRHDSDDEDFSSFRRSHRRSSRFDSDDESDDDEDRDVSRRYKRSRRNKGHGDLDDLDQLDRKVEGIEKKLRGSLNQAEGDDKKSEE